MYQTLDGHLIEVTTMGELSSGRLKAAVHLISHFFPQLLQDFDYWPLKRGWSLNGGSSVNLASWKSQLSPWPVTGQFSLEVQYHTITWVLPALLDLLLANDLAPFSQPVRSNAHACTWDYRGLYEIASISLLVTTSESCYSCKNWICQELLQHKGETLQ